MKSSDKQYLDKLLLELYDKQDNEMLRECEDELYSETKIRLDAALKAKPQLAKALREGDRKQLGFGRFFSKIGTYLKSFGRSIFAGQVPALAAAALAVVAILLNVFPLSKTPVQDLEPRSAWESGQEGNRSISRETATQLKQKIAAALGSSWKRTGLLVGISRYKDKAIPSIPFASSEIREAGQIMTKDMGFSKSDLMWLVDDYASEAGFRAAVFYCRKFSSPNDTLLIHLSCHGIRSADSSVKFQMYDSAPGGGVSLEDILTLLGNFRGRVLIVADACYSANMPVNTRLPERVWILSAAGEDQQAFGPQAGNSLFSDVWFKGLEGGADLNGDGIISLREAFDWTEGQMKTSGQQHPALYGSENADDMILSMAPGLWKLAPPKSPDPKPPASLKLVSNLSVPVKVVLDGMFMGSLREGNTVLPLAPGLHDIRGIVSGPSPGDAETVWRAEVQAEPGQTLERIVMLNPPVRKFLSIKEYFPKVVRNPDGLGAVSASIDSDNIFRISFHPKERAAGQAYSVTFVSEDIFRGVNLTALLGAKPGSTLVLRFDVRKEGYGDSAKVDFFMGGAGNDSLKTRSFKAVDVSNGWREMEIPIAAGDATGVVAGMGIQIDPAKGALSLLIRDAVILVLNNQG